MAAPSPKAAATAAKAKAAHDAAVATVANVKKQVKKQARKVSIAAGQAIDSVKARAHAAGTMVSDAFDSASQVVATTAGAIIGAIEAATSPAPAPAATHSTPSAPVEPSHHHPATTHETAASQESGDEKSE